MNVLFGILGIISMLLAAFLMSNNKKAINIKTVIVGLTLQFFLAVFILKIPLGNFIFENIGNFIKKILEFSNEGAHFVFGAFANIKNVNQESWQALFENESNFIFALSFIPPLIFMMILVNILYYFGIMQRVVYILGKIVNKLMDVSGAEALSNVASSFVGQVSAQTMIKPYLPNLTKSEIMASMTGSMACLSAGIIAVYSGWGIEPKYMLAACIMAAPGALAVSKIIYPETLEPQTKNDFKIKRKRTDVNLLDAVSKGATEGLKVSLNVLAILIALIALIAMIDFFLSKAGTFIHNILHINLSLIGMDIEHLSMRMIFGKIFSVFAFLIGVPLNEVSTVGSLLGTKFILNEAIAFSDLSSMIEHSIISSKSIIISTFALSGFANLSSVAVQISGIGEIAPNQRKNLARVGIKALIAGTITSYISACMAAILL